MDHIPGMREPDRRPWRADRERLPTHPDLVDPLDPLEEPAIYDHRSVVGSNWRNAVYSWRWWGSVMLAVALTVLVLGTLWWLAFRDAV